MTDFFARFIFLGLCLNLLAGCVSSSSSVLGSFDRILPEKWFDDASADKNAATATQDPYPNLADMPDPPENIDIGQRYQKLKSGLMADRANANYSQQAFIRDKDDVLVLSADGQLVSAQKNVKNRNETPRAVSVDRQPPEPPTLAPIEQRLRANRYAKTPDKVALQTAANTPATQMIAQIFFATGAENLTAADRQVIRQVVDLFQQQSQRRIMVVGHSSKAAREAASKATKMSDQGKQQHDKIALARAKTVARVIRAYGVAAEQIVIHSQGADAPAFEETSQAGIIGNQRAEIFFVN